MPVDQSTCAQADLAITVIRQVFSSCPDYSVVCSDVSAVGWIISDSAFGSVFYPKELVGGFSWFKC